MRTVSWDGLSRTWLLLKIASQIEKRCLKQVLKFHNEAAGYKLILEWPSLENVRLTVFLGF